MKHFFLGAQKKFLPKKKISLTFILLSFYLQSFYSHSSTIDESVNEFLSPVSNLVAGTVFYSVNLGDFSFPLIVVWLIVAALYCTFYFRFINIKGFGTALSFLTSISKSHVVLFDCALV